MGLAFITLDEGISSTEDDWQEKSVESDRSTGHYNCGLTKYRAGKKCN